jgi:hypothetical protein
VVQFECYCSSQCVYSHAYGCEYKYVRKYEYRCEYNNRAGLSMGIGASTSVGAGDSTSTIEECGHESRQPLALWVGTGATARELV